MNDNPRVAITGHRPERIPDEGWVKNALSEAFMTIRPCSVIQGMAAGVDLWSAVVAWHQNIPYVAAKPWATHTYRNEDQYLYQWVERHAHETVVVNNSMTYPGPWAYHERNAYMVNRADVIVAVWDGNARGGTGAAVRLACKGNHRIYHINPITQTSGWLDTEPNPTLL